MKKNKKIFSDEDSSSNERNIKSLKNSYKNVDNSNKTLKTNFELQHQHQNIYPQSYQFQNVKYEQNKSINPNIGINPNFQTNLINQGYQPVFSHSNPVIIRPQPVQTVKMVTSPVYYNKNDNISYLVSNPVPTSQMISPVKKVNTNVKVIRLL